MMNRALVAALALGAAAMASPVAGWAAASNCSPGTMGATQGAGLGPACEGQQPTTASTQGTLPGQQGAGTGTTPGGPGGSGGPGSGGSGGVGSSK